ncbi:hypothetical protein K431DRAFT_281019 [Polychaeton citri CBS 116435]|uniref:Acid protease n=1 Tax=Polychaeton citri CBS 116435 TaxID=1314669 RepID=A0A9P4QJ21_9PEZI|nr:hypothetical protein K431DRAFT_281019 [Polychaeton citri CBS 116435]
MIVPAPSLLAIGALWHFAAATPIVNHINADDLGRRQQDNTTAPATTIPSLSSATLPTTLITPTAVPTETGSTTLDLTFSAKDAPLGDLSFLGISVPPSCLDCSTWGNLTLSATEFSFEGNPFDSSSDGTESESSDAGFTGGNFRAAACGVGGRMLFQVEATSLSHTFTLPFKPPIVGFVVPLVGTVGVFLQFDVEISLELPEPATATFGFDFAVPEGAFVDLDFSDLDNSTSYGFEPSEGLVVAEIPVTTNLTSALDGNFTAEAKLRTSLLFGLSDFSVSVAGEKVGVEANAGVFLDLPKLTVDGEVLENVAEDCQKGVTEAADGQVQYLASALHIEPAVGAAVGLTAKAGLEGLGSGFGFDETTTLVDVSVPLPTACIPLPS